MSCLTNFVNCVVIVGALSASNVLAQGGFQGREETSTSASAPPPPLSPMTQQLSANPLATEIVAPKLLRLPSELGNMNYAHVMIAPGTSPVVVASGSVTRGSLVATIPFRFRQMGRLSQPVKAGRDGTGPNVLDAGALGYRINSFRITQGEAFNDTWCFAPPINVLGAPNSRRPQPVCLFKLVAGGWVSTLERDAFPNTLFAPRLQRANLGSVAIDPVSPADAPEKQLELRFKSWSSDALVLEAFVDGQSIELVTLPKKPSGEAKLTLLTQTLDFSPAGNRDSNVRVSSTQRAGMAAGASNQSQLDRLNQVLDENLVLWRSYHGRPGFEALNTQVPSQATPMPLEALSQSRRFMPNDVIATQSIAPNQIFESQSAIATRTKQFGKAGDILFRVNVEASMHVLCAYNPADVPPPSSATQPQARDTYCLEDSDNNSTYDTVWRTPTFAPGSRYHLLDLADSQKLNGDAAQAVRVRPTNLAQMRPDIASLIYSGPVYDPVLTRPGLVQLIWRYGEGPFAWPILAMKAHFDIGGQASFTANSWKPSVDGATGPIIAQVTNIELSGAANIQIMPANIQAPSPLRRAAIESVVDSINQTVAARSTIKPTP